MHCYFAVSKVCNLRCSYCYVSEYNKSHQDDYDRRALSAAERFVEKAGTEKLPLESVTLHGAEPTILTARTLGQIVNLFAKPTDNDVRIQSNGTHFTPKYLDDLLGVIQDPAKFFIGISMDGSAVIHNPQRNDTWDLVFRNIMELRARNFQTGLLAVVTSLTLKHLKEFGLWVEYMRPLVHSITFKLGEHGFGLTEEEKIQFARWLYGSRNIKQLQAFQPDLCIQDGNECEFYEFDIDGNCYSCNKNYLETGVFANWFEEPFETVVSKRQSLYGSRPVDPECQSCPYLSICHSGCPLTREEGKSVDCRIKKEIYARFAEEGIDPELFFKIGKRSTVETIKTARFLNLLLKNRQMTIGEAQETLQITNEERNDSLELIKKLYNEGDLKEDLC